MGRIQSYGRTPDGRDVSLYHLKGAGGAEAEIMDYGAIVHSLKVPDRDGSLVDVMMGYDNFVDQLKDTGWNCGVMGRVVNRIGEGKIWIKGKLHQLDLPELGSGKAPFILHSGDGGYGRMLFSGRMDSGAGGDGATFYYRDAGIGGFPGLVDVWVSYLLTPDNELQIRYRCLPSEDTVLNITSHCYFNLAGHGSGSIHDHVMQLEAGYYLPAAPGGLPSGEVLKVDGTVFDFRKPKRFGDGLESGDTQIALQGGYDHNLCLSGGGYRECGWVYEKTTGIKMTLSTDMPGVQLYTSGNESFTEGAKEGKTYDRYGAFCLETQYYPDATAHSHFPQPVFPGNQVFESQTAYRFSNGAK